MPKILTKDEREVQRKIINAARHIRKKHLALKLERDEGDEALNKILGPITIPLNKLAESTTKNKEEEIVKMEKITPPSSIKKQPKPERSSQKYVEFQPTEMIAEKSGNSDNDDDDDDNVFMEVQSLQAVKDANEDLQKSILEQTEVYKSYLDQYPKIAHEFIDKYFINSDEIDHTYGLQHNAPTETWKMGTEKVDFLQNGDIRVGDSIYKGNRGLYELLFLKKPMHFTENDRVQFQKILKQTSVHKRDFSPLGQLRGSRSVKYRDFVKPLITAVSSASLEGSRLRHSSASNIAQKIPKTRSQTKSGSALLEYNEKPKEYIYYDDVNELVDRLSKLDASQTAGNGNHTNEIMSILEELLELGVVEPINKVLY